MTSQAITPRKPTTTAAQRANFALMALRYKAQIGRAIKQRREQLGITQRQLADALGIQEAQTVSRWERGTNMTHDLEKVALALGYSVPELLADIRPPTMKEAKELSGALPPAHSSQLDRIEEKLDRLVKLLEAASTPGEYPDRIELHLPDNPGRRQDEAA